MTPSMAMQSGEHGVHICMHCVHELMVSTHEAHACTGGHVGLAVMLEFVLV